MVVNYNSYNVTTYITKKIKEEGNIYIYIYTKNNRKIVIK